MESSEIINLEKKIHSDKDVATFKTKSIAFKNISFYIESLCKLIKGTSTSHIKGNYELKNDVFIKCGKFLDQLEKCSDETDLNATKVTGALRFGHVAFRDWYDVMKGHSDTFLDELINESRLNQQYKAELAAYLTESFGNKMRIDYGTGHELNFIIFTMGLCNLSIPNPPEGVVINDDLRIQPDQKLAQFVQQHGCDILSLFAHRYLRLCRSVQKKFRLEPAGSRGVYNMDDYQFLPFLFGSAQLCGTKYIPVTKFYEYDQVDMFKKDFIFIEAVDFILNNKRGPFNEHSYTLWCFTSLGNWDNVFSRIRNKFYDDVLSPFPINQHILFGTYILPW